MKCGIIGWSTVGKTTVFNLLTKGNARVRKYGGAAADAPNVGMTTVPDPRLDFLTRLYSPKKHTPAAVEFVDVAGMVPGQAKADGFSPAMLAALREADALLHVVRCFTAPDIPPPNGRVDPARDAELVDLELMLADLAVVERRLDRLQTDRAKHAVENDTVARKETRVLERLHGELERAVPLRTVNLTADEERLVRGYRFLSQKPLILVANIDEDRLNETEPAPDLFAYAAAHSLPAAALSATLEGELAQLDPSEAALFMNDLGLAEAARDRLLRQSYRALKLLSFFTVGEDECRAWTLPAGSTAVDAAGKIHSDLARGFIRAEVVSFEAFQSLGSWSAAKTAGRLRLEGKEYVVQDGDLIDFRFNA